MTINTVAIAGSGTMGAGIAQVCAQAGIKTILYDIKPEMLVKAKAGIEKGLSKLVELNKINEEGRLNAISLIQYVHEASKVKADLIIEAILEKKDLKTQLFNTLADFNSPETIYATNTSSIPITQIAAEFKYPGKVVGIHFFNPAQIMKLVEIISGAATEESVVADSKAFVDKLGKVGVMAKDAPGFIVNRVARPYYVEALKLMEEGVADFATIDTIMESCGFKMGPFRLMDLIGIDTNYSVTESQFALFNYEPRFRPNRIQKQKVDAGLHGKKTGKGFYNYE
ncbi:MAG: 3-hydroxybutyryl-CoA dehydrogenase [Bacteroidia bacterium]|nr:3-hydroxybutyryl-CoA dehydrogenase [Bacteroidia bacterium]